MAEAVSQSAASRFCREKRPRGAMSCSPPHLPPTSNSPLLTSASRRSGSAPTQPSRLAQAVWPSCHRASSKAAMVPPKAPILGTANGTPAQGSAAHCRTGALRGRSATTHERSCREPAAAGRHGSCSPARGAPGGGRRGRGGCTGAGHAGSTSVSGGRLSGARVSAPSVGEAARSRKRNQEQPEAERAGPAMALICSISNEVPEHPCVSPVSNHVYERRLIEKYIAENGTDPVNNQPLSEEQLIDIKVAHPIRPKPPSATSIPAILKALQDEWDAVMLHSFTLRQQLQTTRQELSHALYQHDAACRVIARLTKEVTAAREALATLKPQAGLIVPQAVPSSQPNVSGAGESMDLGELAGMTPEIIQKLQDKATVLTTERKKRGKTVPEELVKPEELSKYRQVASHVGLHSASIPGILALDLCPSDTNKILTGGADKNVIVFDKSSEQILATLKGHSKKVTSVVFHPSQDLVFSASPDATIRIWSVPNASCVQVVRAHEGSVTGLSLHATGDYLLSSSDDQYWAFSDIQTGRVLTKVTDESSGCALTCAQFHPDGLIFGTGTMDSQIKIWDLKERTNVANFPGHSGPITSIAFSENGYYLATAADDSSVKLWDLRKLKNFKTLQLDNNFEVKSLIFDQSGTYLALGGTDVQIYICKQWTEILHFTEHSGLTTGVAFGHHAKFIASTGMDRSLKFYSL
uniref:Pre-mRNA-processing factor 19 n=7 Tax=Amniota TaxID=32524 RepID=A0A669R1V6_PHACC